VAKKGGFVGGQKSALSVQGLLVCRPRELSYLRNLNVPFHLLANAHANSSIDTAAIKVTPRESIARVRSGKAMGPLTSPGASRHRHQIDLTEK
jgi:hypothetical protein